MSLSSIVVLIVACIVLYGGLFVTVSKAAKSAKDKKS